MKFAKQLQEKNDFLKKAYEAAYEYAPSSPLSVSLNPIEFGNSIGFNRDDTKRIMMELVDDGFVTSSLGMGMLVVTNKGLNYLWQLETESKTMKIPSVNFNVGDNSTVQFQHGTINSNQIIMKQSEKLDLILRELYKHKNDGKYYSIGWILETLNVPIDSVMEINKIGHRLKDDGYVNVQFTHNDCSAELTSHGIEYCEEDSYSYSGHSIINNNYSISIVNSPNANIVSQSNDVTINQNISDIHETIEKIRETIAIDTSLEKGKAKEILDCLEEIQQGIRNNQKPKFAVKSLVELTGAISSITSLVITLGQFVGLIPGV